VDGGRADPLEDLHKRRRDQHLEKVSSIHLLPPTGSALVLRLYDVL
jgi:hypothetical protein